MQHLPASDWRSDLWLLRLFRARKGKKETAEMSGSFGCKVVTQENFTAFYTILRNEFLNFPWKRL